MKRMIVNFDIAISREKRRDVKFFAVKYNRKKTSRVLEKCGLGNMKDVF